MIFIFICYLIRAPMEVLEDRRGVVNGRISGNDMEAFWTL